MDCGSLFAKSCSSSSAQSSTIAILERDLSEISPDDSNRFIDPRLTPEISDNLSIENLRLFRRALILSAIFRPISPGVFVLILFIANILTHCATFVN